MIRGEEVEPRLRQFLDERAQAGDAGSDEDLMTTGRINSLFVIELVVFLEREFGVAATMEDLGPPSFSTIRDIVGFVVEKQRLGPNYAD